MSRDILDKTMGSNVPVLRHLAEEAAQQKSRHVALVYGEGSDHVTDIYISAEHERSDRRFRVCLLILVFACCVILNVRVDADGVGGYRVVCVYLFCLPPRFVLVRKLGWRFRSGPCQSGKTFSTGLTRSFFVTSYLNGRLCIGFVQTRESHILPFGMQRDCLLGAISEVCLSCSICVVNIQNDSTACWIPGIAHETLRKPDQLCPVLTTVPSPFAFLVRKFSLWPIASKTAALLQCAIDASPEPTATDAADEVRLGDLAAVSMAAISRHCGDFLSSLSLGGEGLPWEARVDVPYWLDELENLKVGGGGLVPDTKSNKN